MDALVQVMTSGMQTVLQPYNLAIIVLGTFWGLIFGAVPGLTATMGVAIALPFTYQLDTAPALCLLSSIYIGAISGGFISAGLLNMPGTPSSIATAFDANPMVKQGKASLAMSISLASSLAGGLLAVFAAIVATYALAQVALKFGPFEYFAVGILAFAGCVGMFGDQLLKSITSLILGLLLAMIGSDVLTGVKRLTFGIPDLTAGIDILPLLMGLFGLGEIFYALEQRSANVVPESARKAIMGFKGFWEGFKIVVSRSQIVNFFRSFFIGFAIGVFPGVGGATSSVVAYGMAKSTSKYPEKFGKGIPDGIVASETANNATIAGALVPLLSLGIPGDSVTAVMIGGFIIHGLFPGPLMFRENPEPIYVVFASQIVANIAMVLLGILLMRLLIRTLSIRAHVLLPIITAAMIVGSFALNSRVFDIAVTLIFGFVGYVFKKTNFPTVPLITAFILGPIIEKSLRQGLASSEGSLLPLFTRPMSLGLLIGALLLFLVGIYVSMYAMKRYEAGSDRQS